uniref:Putative secreted protein n=1 Tax=Anopheles darlingi TaxID=43151 RepID=A0A2M4D307_ANODA
MSHIYALIFAFLLLFMSLIIFVYGSAIAVLSLSQWCSTNRDTLPALPRPLTRCGYCFSSFALENGPSGCP